MLAPNRQHDPHLRSEELYALQELTGENRYIRNPHASDVTQQHTLNPAEARRFRGGYLMDCTWSSWSLDYQSVTAKILDQQIEKFKKLKPTGAKKASAPKDEPNAKNKNQKPQRK